MQPPSRLQPSRPGPSHLQPSRPRAQCSLARTASSLSSDQWRQTQPAGMQALPQSPASGQLSCRVPAGRLQSSPAWHWQPRAPTWPAQAPPRSRSSPGRLACQRAATACLPACWTAQASGCAGEDHACVQALGSLRRNAGLQSCGYQVHSAVCSRWRLELPDQHCRRGTPSSCAS